MSYSDLSAIPIRALVTATVTVSTLLSSFPSGASTYSPRSCSAVFFPIATEPSAVVSSQRERLKAAARKYGLDFAGYMRDLDQIAARDPVFRKIMGQLASNKATFAMDRDPETRQQLLEVGFLNIHQTGTSAGVPNGEDRVFVESQYLGSDMDTYSRLPHDLKPKSLYLVPSRDSGIEAPPTDYYEGRGDTWVFKRDAISEDTMFVVGDSFDRALKERLMADPRWGVVDKSWDMRRDSVQDFPLPLELLPIAAPFYYEQVATRNFWRFIDPQSPRIKRIYDEAMDDRAALWIDVTRPDFDESFFKLFPELKKHEDVFLYRPQGNYVEGLHFGPLDVDKVEAFIFRRNPPSKTFVRALEAKGIVVFDGRPGKRRK